MLRYQDYVAMLRAVAAIAERVLLVAFTCRCLMPPCHADDVDVYAFSLFV